MSWTSGNDPQRAPRGVDPVAFARKLGELSQVAREGKDAVVARRQANLLVDPVVREQVVDFVNAEYARGMFDLSEREQRVAAALGARTRGDLARAVEGLEQPSAPRRTSVSGLVHELGQTLRAVALVGLALAAALLALVLLLVVLRLT